MNATYLKWLQSLPDHMLWLMAEDGNEQAHRLAEQRESEYRETFDPECAIPMGEFDR